MTLTSSNIRKASTQTSCPVSDVFRSSWIALHFNLLRLLYSNASDLVYALLMWCTVPRCGLLHGLGWCTILWWFVVLWSGVLHWSVIWCDLHSYKGLFLLRGRIKILGYWYLALRSFIIISSVLFEIEMPVQCLFCW